MDAEVVVVAGGVGASDAYLSTQRVGVSARREMMYAPELGSGAEGRDDGQNNKTTYR